MAREYRQQVDKETGERVIVAYDDGRYVEHFADPGWFGAEDDQFQRRIQNMGRTVAGWMPQDPNDELDRARDWAQDEGYYQALEGAYPGASAVGQGVASFANPLSWMPGGSGKLANFALNQATALTDEYLDYDPNKQVGDYGAAATGAALGDVALNLGSRVIKGAFNIADVIHERGLRGLFNTGMPDSATNLTERGYRLTRPSQMFDRDHPARGTMERMEMASESSALPSRVMAENEEYNKRRLNNTLAKSLGLDGNYDYVDESVLFEAETRLDGIYNDLAGELPETVEIPHSVAEMLQGSEGYRYAQQRGLDTYSEIDRYFAEVEAYKNGGTAVPRRPTIKSGQLFALRSGLTKDAADITDANVVQSVREQVDILDNTIADQVDSGNTEWLDDFARAREQWEVLFSAQRPGVFGKEGNVNPLSLARSMSAETNFGRRTYYGDENMFTNSETADLAGDLMALSKPETYANSRTTDRASWLKFAQSIVDDPLYAAATAGNTALVNKMLNSAESPGLLTGSVNAGLAGVSDELPSYLRRAGGTGRSIPGQVGSQFGAQDAINLGENAFQWLGVLPSPEVRDEALGVFKGSEDDTIQK